MFDTFAPHSDHESLDLVLQASDLVHEIGCLVGGNAGSNNGTADSAGAAKRSLAWDVDVWNVLRNMSVCVLAQKRGQMAYLVFTEKREVEKDGERSGVCCEDDDLGDTTIESLCSLVGSLLQLPSMACLLYDIQQLLGQSRIGDGPG